MPVNVNARSNMTYKFLLTLVVVLTAQCFAQAENSDRKLLTSLPGASEFTHPHKLIDVGSGRKMNIDCRGTGPVTVVFDSGLSDWSSIWALIQPSVATQTRACTYDRAGMGYSDPATLPRTPENIVRDLHILLELAGVAGPLIMVGHSLGGFNMKLYAVSYSRHVVGLVLVDPTEESREQRASTALRAKFGDEIISKYYVSRKSSFAAQNTQYATCSDAAKASDLDAKSALYKECTDPEWPSLGAEIADASKQIQIKYAYQAAQLSEFTNSVLQVPEDNELNKKYAALFDGQRPLGDMPLIVLSRTIINPKQPFSDVRDSENVLLHEKTAALSTRGLHKLVPHTGHNIEIDEPQSIIDAVAEVMKTCCAVQ
jgi:pimeloyl-ACP methyl ester carboxylesterase